MEIVTLLSKYPYADARIEKGIDNLVRIQDEEIKVSSGTSNGISVRVLINGSWGFASSNGKESIGQLLKKAETLARLEKGKIKLATLDPLKKNIKIKIKQIDPDDQVKALLEEKKSMAGKAITSKKISASDSFITKEFYSSEGTEITQQESFTFLSCACVARDGATILRGVETQGSRKGFDALNIHKSAKGSKEKAERLLGAPVAPRGRFSVVLDPEMTGVFSHEALGHAVEADSVIDRESILSNKMGKRIGSELVSIIDDPTADGFGSYVYDDEGVEAKKTTILENGVLKSYINSRETAARTSSQPNGHARSCGYDSVPIVRMSNTFMQKGKHDHDEVFDVKKGIYIKGMKGGSVDIFSGGFMFKAEEAYEIKNGELGKVMRDAAISGNILKTLRDVEAVGKDFGTSVGMCGKGGQDVPVSDGGPHIRVKSLMVG